MRAAGTAGDRHLLHREAPAAFGVTVKECENHGRCIADRYRCA